MQTDTFMKKLTPIMGALALVSATGFFAPPITHGTSGTRIRFTQYTYHASYRDLTRRETWHNLDDYREVEYSYDSLIRLESQAVDPVDEDLITQY